MDNGKIVAAGTQSQLVKIVGQMDRITLTLNAEGERVREAWKALPDVSQVSGDDGHMVVLAEDSNRVLPRLFETATARGVRITSIDIKEPNLEAVFLHLTGRALRDG
jgi:ABC-2 type transport system ATP-binding protein